MPRRQFLATAAAALPALSMAAGAVPGSRRIERVETWPVVYPMKGYFKFFHGGRNQGGRAAVLVRLTADDGTVGWGQSVPIPRWSDETLEGCAIALRDYFGPVIIGRDPADLPGLHAALDQAIAPGFTTGMPIARAGIDIAVWDMLGRAAGKPLHELWQKPAPKPLLLSWTVNVKSIDDAAKSMEEGSAQGFKNFNIKVAPDLDFDEKLTREVRRLAPDTFLWADANGGYDEETALKAAPRLAAAGADVLEAPMKPNRIRAYQKITKLNALPILMDEGVISVGDLEEFLALGMMNGMAAKPARVGGITTCMAQIDLLRERGLLWLGSGLTDPDISLAATIAVYGTRELQKPAALNGPQFLSGCVLKESLVVKDGYLQPPKGPGLGVEVDLEKAKALAVQV
jgi:L-alanine-DL-glutamate epimerase-like enolase superfamily enzyme